MCRLPSTSARFSFQIKAIIDRVDGKRRRKWKVVASDVDQKEIAPFGRDPPAHDQPPRNDDDGGNNDDEDEEEEEDRLYPTTGNLLFPCPSCNPINATGYVCPVPIIAPTPQEIQDEQAVRGNLMLVGPPARGQWLDPGALETAIVNGM